MFIDIAKLLFQKDTRDALKELVALIRKKPEWQADLITLNEKLGYTDEPRAGVLVQFLREVLLKKEWPPKRAGVAEFVIQELVDNAFHHGKPADGSSGAVRINATLTSSWVSCRITDDGPGFDLAQTLEQQARGEPSGLSQIHELASKLVQDGRNTVEVVVRNTLGAIEVMVIDGVQVVSMRGRLGQAEFDLDAEFSRIEAALDPGAPLLIDLSEAQYVASKGLRLLALIHRRNQALGQQSVLVVTPDSAIAEIVRISRYDKIFDCVTSRPDGLAKLSTKPLP
jgi:anti-sigma regulatory factor (Ser/Thr protein kinase)/anti-anti-sigma regulatory factor